mmetsp:Transcript_16919/g.31578  ORF Transcript_16919/g.31578 Transcript_16919/m.31578 type:complete len:971 (-) Transcript_16919:71-2983(-)
MGNNSQACCLTGAQGAQDNDLPLSPVEPPSPSYRAYPVPLFYVEKRLDSGDMSSVRTPGGSTDIVTYGSFAASTANTSVTKALNVLQATGPGLLAVPPGNLDKAQLGTFRSMLESHGIDLSKWGSGGAKSVEHLFWETYEQRGCIINVDPVTKLIKRMTRLVKIRLIADIFGVEHVLFSRLQFMNDGQTIERRQVPLKKLTWNVGYVCTDVEDKDLYAENCPHVEDWKTAVKKALKDRLGLSERWQVQHLEEDVHAYVHRIEDQITSPGYPGLNTVYGIHEVTLRIVDPESPGVHCIGLPSGQEFATTEGDFNFSRMQDDEGLAIGTQLNIWTWAVEPKCQSSPTKKGPLAAAVAAKTETKAAEKKAPPNEAEQRLLKQVPIRHESTQVLFGTLGKMHRKRSSERADAEEADLGMRKSVESKNSSKDGSKDGTKDECGEACPYLAVVQEGRQTDWQRVQNMAKRIADPDYSLSDFHQDLSAFPELDWYLLEHDQCNSKEAEKLLTTSSGRTMSSEYQRTIGAFFAIYWLMRLHCDGKEGFSFGVDEDWKPLKPKDDGDERLYPAEKRLKFFKESEWEYFMRLLLDAELVYKDGNETKVNENRVVTLLALTAIHDIMKVQVLLPVVQKEHAPYHNYQAGDTIGDHDHALSYVMDYYPELLPSFCVLDEQEKRSVQFTQCQLCFNHGWLVQAEAPPGSVFTTFRELLIRDHQSQIRQRDIALYFVHWLTDLAGAEPTPLGGCEKFVIKFPLPVLNSFLRSFEFVQKISDHTETEVMEEYLQMRWSEGDAKIGPMPKGDSAIAKMRLLCMAQMNARPILKAYDQLPDEDKEVLSVEMARTGCIGQTFGSHICPIAAHTNPVGPALLIYYGPAFLQNLGNDDAVRRLSILAEVYRCARELWPASVAQVGSSVTVRVDTIKALRISELQTTMKSGDVWLLVRHNDSEAFIECSSKKKLNKFIANHQAVQILDIPW